MMKREGKKLFINFLIFLISFIVHCFVNIISKFIREVFSAFQEAKYGIHEVVGKWDT